MTAHQIIGGILHAPFFIFIEGGQRYSDKQLLELLDLRGYQPCEAPSIHSRSLAITEDARWTHIADDWFYTLWHSRTIRARIAELGQTHEIFTCSVGDSDHSFNFEYFQ